MTDSLDAVVRPILVVLAVGFGVWSVLAVARAPAYAFWKWGVAATEWGHWLAMIVLLLAVLLVRVDAPSWSVAIALIAAVLYSTPVIRAARFAPRVRSASDDIFAPSRSGHGSDYEGAGVIVPFSFRRIFHVPIPRGRVETLRYAVADGQALLLDIYRPLSGRSSVGPTGGHPFGRAPLVLLVHAGSWRSGDRRELSGFNRYLASRGIGVAAIDYRLAPNHRFPSAVDDIVRALDLLLRIAGEHGCASDRIVLLGRSAGGHLALSAAYRPDVAGRIRGVAGLYAPTDLCWSWQNPSPRRYMDSNRVIRDFLGGSFEKIPEVFEAASPLRQVTTGCPPTLLIHGGKDELVSPLQSARLRDRLAELGIAHLHVQLPWGNHAMEANIAGPSGQMTTYLVERFIDRVTSS